MTLNVVNTELELVSATKEQAFPVPFRDWDRIHDLIAALPGPERVAGHLAWAMVETAIGSALALIPWTAAYDTLTDANKLRFAWVTPVLVAAFAFAVLLAAISFWYDNSRKAEHHRTASHICDDMDSIAQPFRTDKQEAQ